MSNINKQAYHADGGDIGTGRLKEISDNPYGDEEKCWLAKRVLALLDELEAAQSYAKERDEENQDLMLTVGRLRVERETSEAEMDDALCQLLPGVQYMDPPDGGSPSLIEQVRRMVADYRERIAELEVSHSNLREAMAGIHNTITDGGAYTPLAAIMNASKLAYDESAAAAGIITKVGE